MRKVQPHEGTLGPSKGCSGGRVAPALEWARACGGSGVRGSVLGLRHQRSNVGWSDDCCRPVCQPKANCTLAAIRLAAWGCDVDCGGPRKTAKWLPGC